MIDAGLAAHLEDALAPLGAIRIRRMFGGAGLFVDGLMIGLIDGAALYLKVDDEARAAFEAEGMAPFSYMRKGSPAVLTSYWRAPERLLDDPEELLAWGRIADAAARRSSTAAVARPRRAPRPRPRGAGGRRA